MEFDFYEYCRLIKEEADNIVVPPFTLEKAFSHFENDSVLQQMDDELKEAYLKMKLLQPWLKSYHIDQSSYDQVVVDMYNLVIRHYHPFITSYDVHIIVSHFLN